MRQQYTVPKPELLAFYDAAGGGEEIEVEALADLGLAARAFKRFVSAERDLTPLDPGVLIDIYDSCADPGMPLPEVQRRLRLLAPGGQHVGFRQVNTLTDHYNRQVIDHLKWGRRRLLRHDSAGGTGGDFFKTTHATTLACLVAAPLRNICKIGNGSVTSDHGSLDVIRALGYRFGRARVADLNRRMSGNGFAYMTQADLGVRTSTTLARARRLLWSQTNADLASAWRLDGRDRHQALAQSDLALDVFKVIKANAQPLRPAHHTAGVCHTGFLPYVLGMYLHLSSTGVIVHGYDGIDEFSTGSCDPTQRAPNNIVIRVGRESVTFAELAPEDIGLRRSTLADIAQQPVLDREVAQLRHVLEGRDQGPRRDLIVANAALILVAAGLVAGTGLLADDLRSGVRLAKDLIQSGWPMEGFTAACAPRAGANVEADHVNEDSCLLSAVGRSRVPAAPSFEDAS